MRLVTYQLRAPVALPERVGALDGDDVVDLADAYAALRRARPAPADGVLPARAFPATMLELLEHEEPGMAAARAALDFARAEDCARVPLADVRLRAPIPRPPAIRDFMLIEEHLRNLAGEVPDAWHEIPVHWKTTAASVHGPDDDVAWPAYTERLDYELELCAVVGRRVRAADEDAAAASIAGYAILNDWSARDIQLREMSVGIGPAFGKDFACSIGPCLATPDELDPLTATMRARVNGEEWSRGTVGAMRFTFPQVIARVSAAQELQPGDVLGSGTVGRGCGFELDRWLVPGDVVELEVDGIGVLRNRVVGPHMDQDERSRT